ncbi:MAG: DNA polymerase Y family protein [Acetobacteraceae bacterium]
MRRVVSLWFPTLATDRLNGRHAGTRDTGAPLVTAHHDGRRRVIAAADMAARGAGLSPGMTLAQAQAMVPGLAVQPADPEADAAALRHIAAWCLRYAPLAAPDPPDGVWMDITGCAHLFGGEGALLRDVVGHLSAQGLSARAAVADTPGAAHAVARFGNGQAVVPPGNVAAVLASLPVDALRPAADMLEGLRLLGIERIGQLAELPRAPLVRRFGAALATRLDQALGRVFEPIVPVFPPDVPQIRRGFVEPLLTAEAFSTVIACLTQALCAEMEKAGQGTRRLDLLFERVDGSVQALRIGTARPSRNPRHLARMLDERLEQLDPGLGVEAMWLVAPWVERLAYVQASVRLTEADDAGQDIAPLVDRLANRFGAERVYRIAPVESDVPERAVRRLPVLAQHRPASWPADLPRPVRLLDPPQPVEAMALLPDHPPVAFTWRRVRHRVRHADGPERIAGEWWKRDGETRSVRDYFRVEDEEGRRFWLFRRGDGTDTLTGDMRWFLHGFF